MKPLDILAAAGLAAAVAVGLVAAAFLTWAIAATVGWERDSEISCSSHIPTDCWNDGGCFWCQTGRSALPGLLPPGSCRDRSQISECPSSAIILNPSAASASLGEELAQVVASWCVAGALSVAFVGLLASAAGCLCLARRVAAREGA